ncbi:MAG: VCBS repeat-containing protein [Acidobacteria bacterium]|nr:VCBS repeat-containing protein [Acidobacteriota bacterium]
MPSFDPHASRGSVVTFLSIITLLVGLEIVSSSQVSSPQVKPGTKRMAARLKQYAQSASLLPNHPMNAEAVKMLRQQVANARDLRLQFELRVKIANTLLLSGRSSEAVQDFREIQQWVQQNNIPLSTEVSSTLREFLALAYLRLGEQENCIAGHGRDSCFLPIRGSGVHKIDRGSRGAVQLLTAALKEKPNDLGSRWLLNIAYMTLGEHPDKVPAEWLIPIKTFDSDYDIKRFYDAAPALGLDVMGLSGGSIMEDFDGDGYLDIMASSWGMRDQLRYFHNSGDGTFSDYTERAGLTGEVGGLNICHTDYNNDGYPDVLVLRGAWLHQYGDLPSSLLRNNGEGTFEDVTETAGLLSFRPTQAAAWGDYDNDGWIDLFVGNESDNTDTHPCQLYHNNKDGTFTDVAARVGVSAIGYVKGVAWGDYDNDGRLDLYVSRMGHANILFRNEGPKNEVKRVKKSGQPQAPGNQHNWLFSDVTQKAGVGEPLMSFPTWFWDYDNDGWLDIFVAGFSIKPQFAGSLENVVKDYLGLPTPGEHPRLFHNNHDGTFADVTRSTKLDRVQLVMGSNFGDFDNDGFLDCYLGTGEPDLRTLMPNRAFRNVEGKFFQDVTTSGGFGHLQKGHGVSFGDIDNDGDQDIYEVMGGWYSGDVYQNVLYINPGHANHWITLRLEGVRSNRSAIGARIKVTVDAKEGIRNIYATVSTGGSFGSSSLQQEIGLDQITSIQAVEVNWPATGQTQIFKKVAMDHIYKIREGEPNPTLVNLNRMDCSPESLKKRESRHSHPRLSVTENN